MKLALMATGIAGLLLTSPATTAQPSDQLVFEGVAKVPDSDRVIYREQHRVAGECREGNWRPQKHTVDYRRPGEKEPFATKTLAYPASLLTPEVDFQQPDFDERLQIDVTGEELDIRWSAAGPEGGNWTLDITPQLVVDAGFDHFVRRHWRTLTAGEAVEFRFLAPTRGEAYSFVAEPAAEPVPGADHSFRIRPTSLFLRLAVDPIRLGYSQDALLTHYVGLGNIRRNQDENYQVAIDYRVPSAPPCPLVPGS